MPKTKTESTVPAKRPFEKSAPAGKTENKPEETKSQSSSAANSQTSSKPAAKPAPKREKSNLFSSFAKAKPKQKTSTSAESVSLSWSILHGGQPINPGIKATPSGAEDGKLSQSEAQFVSSRPAVVLDDASEEEAEELFPNSGDTAAAAATRESKKEREDKLKAMMEDDDADGGTPEPKIQGPRPIAHGITDEEMPDADEEVEPVREPTPVEQPPPSKPAELKEEVTVQGGRRRGKRQVMKKRTVKDEEGYLGKKSLSSNH